MGTLGFTRAPASSCETFILVFSHLSFRERPVWEEPPRAGPGRGPTRSSASLPPSWLAVPALRRFSSRPRAPLGGRVAGERAPQGNWVVPHLSIATKVKEGTYGKSRPARARAAASNSRKGPLTTSLLSGRFRLRWRDRTLVSDAFFCLLGFSIGKRRSKKSWSKTRIFHPGADPPQHRDRGYLRSVPYS